MSELPALISSQVSANASLMMGPRANTATTIRAAMPAMSRPYSTADAPRSSILARRASSSILRVLNMGGSLMSVSAFNEEAGDLHDSIMDGVELRVTRTSALVA